MLKIVTARQSWLALGVGLLLALPAVAHNGGGNHDRCDTALFGSAFVNEDGVIEISSEDPDEPFGGVSVTPNYELELDELDELSADYDLAGSTSGLGSPRFSLRVDREGDGDADGNIFVYLGDPPSFIEADDADDILEPTGNLVTDGDERWDLSQLGGPFYGTYEEAVDRYPNAVILSASLVVDGPDQTVLFDNIVVDDCLVTADDLQDTDEDGIPDEEDHCDDSDLRPTVDINGDATGGTTTVPNKLFANGCTIQDEINELLDDQPRNHGQFVSSVGKIAKDAQRAGLISSRQASELQSAAARSDVGKPKPQPNNGGKDKDKDKDKDKGGKGKDKKK